MGNRDYVISKLFDKDGDGKLNAEERRAAEEAIRNVSLILIVGGRKQFLLERRASRRETAVQNYAEARRLCRC